MAEPRRHELIDKVLAPLEAEARQVMTRVGLTEEDLAPLAGLPFEEFSRRLDEIAANKRKGAAP